MADDGRKASPGEVLTRFLNEASKVLYEAGEQVREQAVRGKQLFDEKLAERELNRSFQELGKSVFEAVARGKVELPESFGPQLEALRAQIKAVAEASEARSESGAPKDDGGGASPPG